MPSRGLVGFVSRATNGLTLLLESSLVRIFVFLVVGAAVMAVYEHTLAKATTQLSFYKLMFLGLGAIIAELLGVHRMIVHWHKAELGSTLAWSAVWVVGFTFSLYNALGSAATFQAERSNIQKASAVEYTDTRSTLDAARASLAREEASLADMRKLTFTPLPTVDGKTISSVGAAQAIIDGLKANTRFWELTEGGKQSAGKETRAYVKNYGDAVAAKADLEDRKAWDGKLAVSMTATEAARKALGQALATSKSTATVTDDVPPFVAFVANRTGYKPDQVAWIEPAQTSLVNMLLVSFAGLVMGLAAIEGKQRTKFIDWSPVRNLMLTLFKAITGKTDLDIAHGQASRGKVIEVQTHTKEVIKDEGILGKMRAHAQANAPHLMAA
jgi:hypothetical protein